MKSWQNISGDYYRGTIAVKSLSDGWYAVNSKRGFLHQAGEMWLFKTSEAAMEMADVSEDGDFDWCGMRYTQNKKEHLPDEDIELEGV
jgi:hypothetical protein